MKSRKERFDAIVGLMVDLHYLGDHDYDSGQITLYDVPNIKRILTGIKESIAQITPNFKWIVLDNDERVTNIKILDIDL